MKMPLDGVIINIPEEDVQAFLKNSSSMRKLLEQPYRHSAIKSSIIESIQASTTFDELFNTLEPVHGSYDTLSYVGSFFGMKSLFLLLLQELEQEANNYLNRNTISSICA